MTNRRQLASIHSNPYTQKHPIYNGVIKKYIWECDFESLFVHARTQWERKSVGDVFITIKFVHFAYLHIYMSLADPPKINCDFCATHTKLLVVVFYFTFSLIFIIYWKASRVQGTDARFVGNCMHFYYRCTVCNGWRIYIHHDGLIVANGSRCCFFFHQFLNF